MAQRHAEALREDERTVRPPEPRPLAGGGGVLAVPAKKTTFPPFLSSISIQLFEKEVRTGRTGRNSFDRRNRLTPLPLT